MINCQNNWFLTENSFSLRELEYTFRKIKALEILLRGMQTFKFKSFTKGDETRQREPK